MGGSTRRDLDLPYRYRHRPVDLDLKTIGTITIESSRSRIIKMAILWLV